MNVVAFLGSPRAGGNTEILLAETLKAVDSSAHHMELFKLGQMDIRFCRNCGECDDTGVCPIEDDMAGVYDAIRRADRVILASPVYFFGLSAQTKVMIDRCQCFWCEKYLLKRPIPEGIHGRQGLFLLVGGMKKDREIACGDATATAFFRSISVQRHETVGILGVDKKGAIVDHPTALRDGYEAGMRLMRD